MDGRADSGNRAGYENRGAGDVNINDFGREENVQG